MNVISLIPPAVLDMRVPTEAGRRFRLWLPVFLLWPLIWLLELVVLVPSALVDIAFWIAGRRYHHYSLLLLRVFGLLGEMRGLIIRVGRQDTGIDMTFV